jgi:hypothetical protein
MEERIRQVHRRRGAGTPSRQLVLIPHPFGADSQKLIKIIDPFLVQLASAILSAFYCNVHSKAIRCPKLETLCFEFVNNYQRNRDSGQFRFPLFEQFLPAMNTPDPLVDCVIGDVLSAGIEGLVAGVSGAHSNPSIIVEKLAISALWLSHGTSNL